jgi:hypothetical protein
MTLKRYYWPQDEHKAGENPMNIFRTEKKALDVCMAVLLAQSELGHEVGFFIQHKWTIKATEQQNTYEVTIHWMPDLERAKSQQPTKSDLERLGYIEEQCKTLDNFVNTGVLLDHEADQLMALTLKVTNSCSWETYAAQLKAQQMVAEYSKGWEYDPAPKGIWVVELISTPELETREERFKELGWAVTSENYALKPFVTSTPQKATELATKELESAGMGIKIDHKTCDCCTPDYTLDIERGWSMHNAEMRGVLFTTHGDRKYVKFTSMYDAQTFIKNMQSE